MNNSNKKIPSISEDRLDNNIELDLTLSSTGNKQINDFLKGRELTQPFTTRIPKDLYTQFRKIAFDRNIKMNQIVVQLIKDYVHNKTE